MSGWMQRYSSTSGLQTEHDLLQTIPGVKKQAAASILAELGPDMNVFGSGRRCSPGPVFVLAITKAPGRKNGPRPCAGILGSDPLWWNPLGQGPTKRTRSCNIVISTSILGSATSVQSSRWRTRWCLPSLNVLSRGQPFQGLGADTLPPQKLQRLVRHHTRRLRNLKRWLPPSFSPAPPASPPAVT